MMKSKKGQGELITTVLIILVVLAAVAIVATFIIRNVRTSTETAENRTEAQIEALAGQADCTGITLDIIAVGTDHVNVTMQAGSKSADDIRIIAGGTACTNGALVPIDPVETRTVTVSGCTLSGKIEAAAVIGTTVCEATGEMTV